MLSWHEWHDDLKCLPNQRMQSERVQLSLKWSTYPESDPSLWADANQTGSIVSMADVLLISGGAWQARGMGPQNANGLAGYTTLVNYIQSSESMRATTKFILRSPPSFGTNSSRLNSQRNFQYIFQHENEKIRKLRDSMRDLVSTAALAAGVLRFVDGTSYALDPEQEQRTQCPLFTGDPQTSEKNCQCHWHEQLGVRAMNHQFLNVLASMC